MIEDLNRRITSCNTPLIKEDARARGWLNKPLIENYRDYLAFHDINYPEMVRKQLLRTSKHCKTIKPWWMIKQIIRGYPTNRIYLLDDNYNGCFEEVELQEVDGISGFVEFVNRPILDPRGRYREVTIFRLKPKTENHD